MTTRTLTVKEGGTIVLNGNVKIKINKMHKTRSGDNYQIVFHIEAPREISVHREEIYNRINPERVKKATPKITRKRRRTLSLKQV